MLLSLHGVITFSMACGIMATCDSLSGLAEMAYEDRLIQWQVNSPFCFLHKVSAVSRVHGRRRPFPSKCKQSLEGSHRRQLTSTGVKKHTVNRQHL
jgi:hypothetical protein